jgi:hypothetical protein
MKGYSLLPTYQHDYHCLSEVLLKLVSLTPAPRQLNLLDGNDTAASRWYR